MVTRPSVVGSPGVPAFVGSALRIANMAWMSAQDSLSLLPRETSEGSMGTAGGSSRT
jgi:hypothetical protein